MHDPEERPRLHWRRLAWGIAVVIVLSALYLAASGPMWWRVYHCYHEPQWHEAYQRSLAPLYRSPQFTSMMLAYRTWWEELPAPRSWKRQFLVNQIDDRRKTLKDARAEWMRREREAGDLSARVQALEAQASLTADERAEAIDIRRRLLEWFKMRQRPGRRPKVDHVDEFPDLEKRVFYAELELKRFDAQ